MTKNTPSTQHEKSLKEITLWKERKASLDMPLRVEKSDGVVKFGLENPEGPPEHLNELMAASMHKAVGMTDPQMCLEVISQTTRAMPGEDAVEKSKIALNLFKEMQPNDAFEAMLISRMIVLHTQYMNYLALATNPELPIIEIRNMNLNRATKLMRVWDEAKERLDKHRRKNDQQIEVKHFHVNANQAIVGSHMQVGGGVIQKKQGEPS